MQSEADNIVARVVTRVRIAANRAVVFTYLANLKYHLLWNPHIQSISSKEELQPGSRYQTTSMVLGVKIASDNVVTKLTVPEELEIENNTGTVRYNVNFRLQEQLDHTVVTCSTTVSADSKAFAFTLPILKRLAQRELQTDMQALKVAVENQLK